MNIKGQLKKLFTVSLVSGFVFGAAVEISPSTIPDGATDANHYYQIFTITLSDNGEAGAWTNGEDIVINFPPTIQLADPNTNSNYHEHVSISVGGSAVTLGATAHSSTTESSLVIDLAAGAAVVAGNKLRVVFPIKTTASSSGTVAYTMLYGGGDEEVGGTNPTVTFTSSAISTATFNAAYSGDNDGTLLTTGNYYPAQLRATTSLLVKVFGNVSSTDKFVLSDGTNSISFEVNTGVPTAN